MNDAAVTDGLPDRSTVRTGRHTPAIVAALVVLFAVVVVGARTAAVCDGAIGCPSWPVTATATPPRSTSR